MSATEQILNQTGHVLFADKGRILVLHPGAGEDPDAVFQEVCAIFDNKQIEQDAEGNISIMAPTGGESSDQNAALTAQLYIWAATQGQGRSFESSVLFILPDQTKMGPDASWVSFTKLQTLSKKDRQEFLRLVPEFVIELKSPSDRLSKLKAKMETWMDHGVELGWLINPEAQSVFIYRNDGFRIELEHPSQISGEGPIVGFELNLEPIWRGLDF